VDATSVIFGIIQTALYIDFAWVYYSRQRVKLRGGGVVDADDLSKSFLVRRIIGRGSRADREDNEPAEEDAALAGQENGTIRPQGGSWGARGISVSADDTLASHDRNNPQRGGGYVDETASGDAQMIDPAHFEDEDDEDADAPPPPAKDDKYNKSVNIPEEAENSSSAWSQSGPAK
jgi:ER lumen protein retaining receptor